MVIEKAIGCLCPLQGDIRPLFLMKSEETTVEPQALLFEHTYHHGDSRITDFLYPAPLHPGKGVDTSHHHTAHTLTHNEVGTRWCLAIMGTRLKTDVNG